MRIQVLSPEIGLPNEKMNHDYWVRKATNEAIRALGHEPLKPGAKEVPDIQIVFSGMKPRCQHILNGKYKVAWIYSRPDEMHNQRGFLSQFDQIYCLTDYHTSKFSQKMKMKAKLLRIGTDKTHTPTTTPYAYDIAYLGSSPDRRVRPITALADHGFKIVVCGWRWNRIKHPNIKVAGQFWPNEKFGEFFNQAPLSYYPVVAPFIEYGIVPIRIMDIYAASDCVCITEANPGLIETFPITPPQFEQGDTDRLIELMEFFLKNPATRKDRQKAIRGLIGRTYKDIVLDIIVDAQEFWSTK